MHSPVWHRTVHAMRGHSEPSLQAARAAHAAAASPEPRAQAEDVQRGAPRTSRRIRLLGGRAAEAFGGRRSSPAAGGGKPTVAAAVAAVARGKLTREPTTEATEDSSDEGSPRGSPPPADRGTGGAANEHRTRTSWPLRTTPGAVALESSIGGSHASVVASAPLAPAGVMAR